MSVRVQDVIRALEDFAPLPLQESYDNAGLQTGLTEAEVSGVLLCLDVTEDVIREALELGCNMIVSHHPLIFHALKQLTDADAVQRNVRLAVQNDIAIYSAHTNLDAAVDGVNYMMAERLGLVDVVLMQPRQVAVDTPLKAQTVQAGSGVIGYLPEGEDSLAFLQRVKQAFGVECLMHNELLVRPIESVAICGGAGDFLLDDALKAGADALVMFQRVYEPDIDIDNLKMVPARVLKEGDGLHEALRWVSIMNENIDCSLSATSGVVNGEDLIKLLLAGADTVQIATVLYTRGIKQIGTIINDLKAWMTKHSYSNIDQFQGKMSMKRIENPDVYMRVQFMKYFAGIK